MGTSSVEHFEFYYGNVNLNNNIRGNDKFVNRRRVYRGQGRPKCLNTFSCQILCTVDASHSWANLLENWHKYESREYTSVEWRRMYVFAIRFSKYGIELNNKCYYIMIHMCFRISYECSYQLASNVNCLCLNCILFYSKMHSTYV